MPFVFSELVDDIEVYRWEEHEESGERREIFARDACASQVVSYDMHDRLYLRFMIS